MSTTLLFVELLIAGIQVLLWFFILLLAVFGYEWVSNISLQHLSDWQILGSVTLLALVYVLGTLFDRLADWMFSKWEKSLAYKKFPDAPQTFAVIRFQIAKENEYLYRHLEYTRSRMRIVRASALNFVITTILALIFVSTRLQHIPGMGKFLVFIGLTGILLTALAIMTWYNLLKSYYGFIERNYPQEQKQRKVEPKNAPSEGAVQQESPANGAP